MISFDEVSKCGTVLHSHGTEGELVIPVSHDMIKDSGMRFIVVEMDGILVPFHITGVRTRGASSSIVRLEGIDTMEKADMLRGRKVWLLKEYLRNLEDSGKVPFDMFVGMYAVDRKKGRLGEITDIDDSTPNVLMKVSAADGREMILPACDEFIRNVSVRRGIVSLDLPDGLTEI
ncbi:MAG: ribosome maturation factor RimM [Bacteroidaceae bacterium]|nr:ribosome maturation factor RimM [Bacteroidaceae bacterium]